MALYVREVFRFFQQSRLECFCYESCVFCICSMINNFYVYAFYHNPGHDGSLYDCLLDSMAWAQSVDDKAVFLFVGNANAQCSEYRSQSLLLISMGVMLLIFAMSGCE